MKKILFSGLVLSAAACTSQPAQVVPPIESANIQTEETAMSFKLTSPAFANGAAIPTDYSCDGRDISPALVWTDPPAGTKSFAIIMDDPDAPIGTWVHWVIFNVPASTRNLKEGMSTDLQLSDGSIQGTTSARSTGYHGPCPPSGTHRYFFKLYALDVMLELSSKADKKDVLAAIEGHVLANTELMGTFSR